MIILAQEAGDALSVLSPFLDYGVIGLFCLALFRRWIIIGGEADDVRAQRDLLAAKNEELHNHIRDHVLPAVIASNRTLTDVARVAEALVRELEEARRGNNAE